MVRTDGTMMLDHVCFFSFASLIGGSWDSRWENWIINDASAERTLWSWLLVGILAMG